MSATAAFACTTVCSESEKIIAAHNPTRSSAMRRPHAKIDNAVSAAAIADGKRAAKSFCPKTLVARDLRPIGEGRLIEAILVIEVRNDVIAALDHLARCFGETRFVAIDQRNNPSAGEVEEQATEE